MADCHLTLFLLLGLLVVADSLAVQAMGGQDEPLKRKREVGNFRFDDRQAGNRAGLAGDATLLEKLLRAPSKRQLCMPGYSYNVVMGDCFPSIGVLRGRGRRF